jgi:hypothetical protein
VAAPGGLNGAATGLNVPAVVFIEDGDGAVGLKAGAEVFGVNGLAATLAPPPGVQDAATFMAGLKVEAFELIALKRKSR